MLHTGFKRFALLAALLITTMIGAPAFAIPASSVTGNGIIWTLTGDATPGVSTSGSFTLSADVSGSTLGTTGYLAEFSLKNFGAGSTATLSNLGNL